MSKIMKSNNSNSYQEEFLSRPESSYNVRSNSDHTEHAWEHQHQNSCQESGSITRPSAPLFENQSSNDLLPPSYDEYVKICEEETSQ